MRKLDLAIIALLAVVFAPAFATLAGVWSTTEYYSHGFLVPVVSYWAYRGEAHRLRPCGRDVRGVLVLGFAALVYAFGLVEVSATAQGLAIVLAVAGLVTMFWGVSGLRVLGFPVGFLLFMVPIPPALLTPLIVWLQFKVSIASVYLLHEMGFAVLREGNVVVIPGGGSLFVAEACSGITSVVTLMSLGVMLAYFTQKSRVRQLALVAVVAPVAMFGNLIRVLVTVLAADRYGLERATTGPLHESAGVLTFLLECLILIGLVSWSRRIPVQPGRAIRET